MRFARIVFSLFASLFLLSSLPVLAQAGVYADFTTASLSTSGSSRMNGATVGGYYEVNLKHSLDFLRVGADSRGTFVGSTQNIWPPEPVMIQPVEMIDHEHINSYLFGPEISLKTHITPLRPYGEILFGVAHESGNVAVRGSGLGDVYSTSQNKGEVEYLAGADWTFFPHFAWRVVEVSYGKFGGISSTNISTGVVLRLP